MSLVYAIQDRESFAQCYKPGDPERAEAMAEAREIRAYLKKRFNARPAQDRIDDADMKLVSIDELRKQFKDQS